MWPVSPRTRSAPSPLEGEGWGGGSKFARTSNVAGPPPLTPPLKGEGNRPRRARTNSPHPHPRRHHPRGARQVRAAGAARRLARCARRDRALGAARSSSPARCASACRRGSPRPPSRRSGPRSRTRSSCCGRRLRRPTPSCSPGSKGRAEKPVSADPAPFRPGDAEPRDRGAGSSRTRSRALRRRVEMGWHPRAGRRRRAGWPADRAALFAHRRGHFRRVPRPDRRDELQRRDRRRALDHARRPCAVVQRAAAAAQPQNHQREAHRRIPRAHSRL